MSIVALAIRMSATRALEVAGATLAENRVFDSAITPLDEMVSAEPRPMIVVSTEDERSEPNGRDMNSGSRDIQLIIETAMSQSVELPGEGGTGVMVPNTDAGLELSLAVLSRQINATLFGRGGGVWGDVFRKLTTGTIEVVSRRGIQSKEGARLAARQTVYTVRAIAEPAFGQELHPQSPLVDFLAACADDEQTEALAEVIRKSIEDKPLDWPAVYGVASTIAGLSDEAGRAIGIEPLHPEGGLVTHMTVAQLDGTDPWTADEAELDAQLPPDP